jgi:hypothetical protein
VANSKGSDQNQNLSPIAYQINGAQSQHEQNMVIAIFVVEDVVFAQTEIKGEFVHFFKRSLQV